MKTYREWYCFWKGCYVGFVFMFVGGALALAVPGCGTQAKGSGGPQAIRIPGGNGDCYAILDSDGRAVGGNCK